MRKDINQTRRERDIARRNSLTAGKREEMNARRREARQNKTIERPLRQDARMARRIQVLRGHRRRKGAPPAEVEFTD